jgi:hypothetical protein
MLIADDFGDCATNRTATAIRHHQLKRGKQKLSPRPPRGRIRARITVVLLDWRQNRDSASHHGICPQLGEFILSDDVVRRIPTPIS